MIRITVPSESRTYSANVVPFVSLTTGISGQRVYASPVVRKLARELGVNLLKVKGTGPRGRIVVEDVRGFAGPSGR